MLSIAGSLLEISVGTRQRILIQDRGDFEVAFRPIVASSRSLCPAHIGKLNFFMFGTLPLGSPLLRENSSSFTNSLPTMSSPPAHAGKRQEPVGSHPPRGSPLGVRGKLGRVRRIRHLIELTLAYAEESAADRYSTASRGSPLRARGKLFGELLRCVHHGLTPACAGKTLPDEAKHLRLPRS